MTILNNLAVEKYIRQLFVSYGIMTVMYISRENGYEKNELFRKYLTKQKNGFVFSITSLI